MTTLLFQPSVKRSPVITHANIYVGYHPLLLPQSSLCEMIIQGLEDNNPEHSVQEPWFIRWLWTTTGGAALYALSMGLVTAVSGRCCYSASSIEAYTLVQGDEKNKYRGNTGVTFPAFGRCCGSSKRDMDMDNAERGIGASASTNSSSPAIKSIVANFDAWLFADSKVLWAVLVSKIFEEVSRLRICSMGSTLCNSTMYPANPSVSN